MIPKRRLFNATANQNERRQRDEWEGTELMGILKPDLVAPEGPEQMSFALFVIAVAVAGGAFAGALIGVIGL